MVHIAVICNKDKTPGFIIWNQSENVALAVPSAASMIERGCMQSINDALTGRRRNWINHRVDRRRLESNCAHILEEQS